MLLLYGKTAIWGVGGGKEGSRVEASDILQISSPNV
jgi:hypothetical protein